MLLTYFRVGKVLSVDIEAYICGGLRHIVSNGVFGENRTQDALRGRNGLFLRLNLSFSTPCWIGVQFLILFHVLIFLDMLDLCNLRV